MKSACLITLSYFVLISEAQFFNFFNQQQQQQQQQQAKSYEETFLNKQCNRYLCPQTQECVNSPLDCSCPFPNSQLKCQLPDSKNFVCISKPASNDPAINELYNDPKNANSVRVNGMRDCGWVLDAYNGLV